MTAILQALGSSGAHMGIGRALLRATLTLAAVEADEIWLEAKAPVMTRAATAVRITSFMVDMFLICKGLEVYWIWVSVRE
jgi:hypothetical protein